MSSNIVDNKNKRSPYNSAREAALASYEALFNDLLSLGKTPTEAIIIIDKLQKEEANREEYAQEEAKKTNQNGKKNTQAQKKIEIRIQYALSDLLLACPEFEELSTKEQDDILWGIGFNTKTNHSFREEAEHVRTNGKRDYGVVIYGDERRDKEWLSKRNKDGNHYASWEAREFQRLKDPGYREDIRAIRGGM